jgi:hypothetical protein
MPSWKTIASVCLAMAFGGCYAADVVLGHNDNSSNTPARPSATPTESPDHKFKDDMDDAFSAKMNPDNPAPWNQRFFTDHVIATGHDICEYLGSHTYEWRVPAD